MFWGYPRIDTFYPNLTTRPGASFCLDAGRAKRHKTLQMHDDSPEIVALRFNANRRARTSSIAWSVRPHSLSR
jgi:hypothetical protein